MLLRLVARRQIDHRQREVHHRLRAALLGLRLAPLLVLEAVRHRVHARLDERTQFEEVGERGLARRIC